MWEENADFIFFDYGFGWFVWGYAIEKQKSESSDKSVIVISDFVNVHKIEI